MRSMNVYWESDKDDVWAAPPWIPPEARPETLVSVDCMAASAILSIQGLPFGAYPFPVGIERVENGELKLKMCWNDLGSKQECGGDA